MKNLSITSNFRLLSALSLSLGLLVACQSATEESESTKEWDLYIADFRLTPPAQRGCLRIDSGYAGVPPAYPATVLKIQDLRLTIAWLIDWPRGMLLSEGVPQGDTAAPSGRAMQAHISFRTARKHTQSRCWKIICFLLLSLL